MVLYQNELRAYKITKKAYITRPIVYFSLEADKKNTGYCYLYVNIFLLPIVAGHDIYAETKSPFAYAIEGNSVFNISLLPI